MCEIGKPLEIIDVEPLSLSVPLPRTQHEPEREPALIPAVPATETPLGEKFQPRRPPLPHAGYGVGHSLSKAPDYVEPLVVYRAWNWRKRHA